MTRIYSKALEKELGIDREIGRIQGSDLGPTLVFIAGIHGNEPAGVFALHKVIEDLREAKTNIKGTMIALSGNLPALESSIRFKDADLNRLWQPSNIAALEKDLFEPNSEDERQQEALHRIIEKILETESAPFYFFDLHTTSSETIPFITVNDSLLNRRFTELFPFPKILGIEEFLDGPLLSYINELGYISFGFEAGQHDTISSIDNCESFIHLALAFAESIDRNGSAFKEHHARVIDASENKNFIYEIRHRHEIGKTERFEMQPGYCNFQTIKKGDFLAKSDSKKIYADQNAMVLMPLYQDQGNDGYFLIQRVPRIFLSLSAILRKLKFDRIMPLMPGVHWDNKEKKALLVDLRVARFLAKPFLHLLGYRAKRRDQKHLIIKNREAASRTKEYEGQIWY